MVRGSSGTFVAGVVGAAKVAASKVESTVKVFIVKDCDEILTLNYR